MTLYLSKLQGVSNSETSLLHLRESISTAAELIGLSMAIEQLSETAFKIITHQMDSPERKLIINFDQTIPGAGLRLHTLENSQQQ